MKMNFLVSVVTILSVLIFSTSDRNIPKYLLGRKNNGTQKWRKGEKSIL
jgi:hypothetical protein